MFLVVNIDDGVYFGLIAIQNKLFFFTVLKIDFIALFKRLTETLNEWHILAIQQGGLDF